MTDPQTSNVLRFRRKRRRHSNSIAPAQVLAFPPGRHKRIVAFIAAEMRKQPSADAAEEYLIDHLEIEWRRLAHLGIPDAEIEPLCHAFAKATWRIVFEDQRTWVVA
jgi:hypothetical protein